MQLHVLPEGFKNDSLGYLLTYIISQDRLILNQRQIQLENGAFTLLDSQQAINGLDLTVYFNIVFFLFLFWPGLQWQCKLFMQTNVQNNVSPSIGQVGHTSGWNYIAGHWSFLTLPQPFLLTWRHCTDTIHWLWGLHLVLHVSELSSTFLSEVQGYWLDSTLWHSA